MNVKNIYSIVIFLLLSKCVFTQQLGVGKHSSKGDINYYAEIENVNQLLAIHPSDPSLLQKRATFYMMVGEFDYSIVDIEAAIVLDENNGDARYTKSLILYKRKKYNEAIESATEAIVRNDKNESYYFLRANLYALTNRFREAVKDLNSIITLNSRCDYCYLQKAIWCGYLNMSYEQIKCYMCYLELSDDIYNTDIVKDKLDNLKKSNKYFRDLSAQVAKDIRKSGYPWDIQ